MAGSKMRTEFLCRLNTKTWIAQNLQTSAYFNAKTNPETVGMKKPKPKLNPKLHNLPTPYALCCTGCIIWEYWKNML